MRRDKTVVTIISKVSERPAAKDACLVVIYGLDMGKRYGLEKNSMIIGRSSKADIQIDQESVSRSHAKIINTGKSLLVRDLGSTNGTYVNDQAVDEYVLRDGDMVKIGRTIFKFLSGSNIENAYHEEIYRLTTMDGLTQIYNRRYFLETLERELSRSHRYHRPLSLIMLDLDHFKQVNDTYGHLAGDHILKAVAQLILKRIRREDLLARYGGEEFCLVLPEIDSEGAHSLAEQVRELVADTDFIFKGTTIPLTISLGVACTTGDAFKPESFIQLADQKLYEAKQSGRNRVCG